MTQIYQISSCSRLIIKNEVLSIFKNYIQLKNSDSEAGGVLLGRHLIDSEDIVIDFITTPQKNDCRTRTSFFRSKTHNLIAQKMWEDSNQRFAYLGLWHTHPEHIPSPSMVDMKDWKQAIKKDKYEGDKLFFLIVGQKTNRIWMITQNGDLVELFLKGN